MHVGKPDTFLLLELKFDFHSLIKGDSGDTGWKGEAGPKGARVCICHFFLFLL